MPNTLATLLIFILGGVGGERETRFGSPTNNAGTEKYRNTVINENPTLMPAKSTGVQKAPKDGNGAQKASSSDRAAAVQKVAVRINQNLCENTDGQAVFPIFTTVLFTLLTFYLCIPPAHLWNPPINHADVFHNWSDTQCSYRVMQNRNLLVCGICV